MSANFGSIDMSGESRLAIQILKVGESPMWHLTRASTGITLCGRLVPMGPANLRPDETLEQIGRSGLGYCVNCAKIALAVDALCRQVTA